MTVSFELTAELRADKGKGASRRLRRCENKIPGIIYGGGEDPSTLMFDHNQVIHALQNEAFYSHILTINIAGKKQKAVLKDLQRHPYKPKIIHVDLLRITGKEKITMQVPLHFLNADQAPGVKVDGGIISHLLTSVEIRCLPSDLPEYIEVDLSTLALDQSIHLSDLKVAKGVELVALAHGDDQAVAAVHVPRAAVETEESGAPTAPAAPEAIRQSGDKLEGSSEE